MASALARPLLARLARPAARSSLTITRSLSTTPLRRSDHGPPVIQGSGAKAGTVPTDEEQATGLERVELLGKMEGIDVFLREPDWTKKGTMADPVLVPSLATERIVGCTGYPPEEHRTLWLTLHNDSKKGRCPECGNVFQLQFLGEEHDAHHH
ncbi:hypothetical protein M422DRAFT_26041 [Sphaerobolus stellatus SS14]|nr:hypothetical protein M422DRAFT_26041 [Sphaerobolus stellatus SS14]